MVNFLVTSLFVAGIYSIGFSFYRLLLKPSKNFYFDLSVSFALGVSFIAVLFNFLLHTNQFNNAVNIYCIISLTSFFINLVYLRNGFSKKTLIDFYNQNKYSIVFFLIVFAILALVGLTSKQIGWDGRAIWFLKANAFYIEPFFLNSLFENFNFYYSHWEYPIALPLIQSFLYQLLGGIDEVVSNVFLLTFFFNLMLLIFSLIKDYKFKYLNKFNFLYLCPLVFAPIYLNSIYLGYADIPVSLFFSLSFIFSLKYFYKTDLSFLIVSIIFAATAATIKSEGIMFFIITILVLGLYSVLEYIKNKDIKKFFSLKLLFLAPFLGTILFWEYVKASRNYESEHFVSGWEVLSIAEYMERALKFIYWTFRYVSDTDYFGLFLLGIIVTSFSCIFIVKKRQYLNLLTLLIPLGQFLGYFLLYLLTIQDIDWLIQTALGRLLLQLFPLIFILAISLSIKPKLIVGNPQISK